MPETLKLLRLSTALLEKIAKSDNPDETRRATIKFNRTMDKLILLVSAS